MREKAEQVALEVQHATGCKVLTIWTNKSHYFLKLDPGPDFPAYVHFGIKKEKLESSTVAELTAEAIKDLPEMMETVEQMHAQAGG